ncbi:uncharacterized protein MYCFIDRAFT_195906 [Pseudocercospora fijiensis CIRAD86]|uniref:DM2 domain-containing protein n=1 Tax=Pseudocercospora fijiensis (strain CIRAD86) TaxID=383855 RepID=M3AKA6_PSEFD|nr:uncharacterized protein MYCFIDRAFT_195906 [Pseudocercospora fijiensis CIRAD86]EME85016.1 hypothetical protein MYCFIDRAFT_195906 [Pseudocercospora fijiensis CIRAD86]
MSPPHPNTQSSTAFRAPRPEGTSFVPNGTEMHPQYDQFLDGFSLQFGPVPNNWTSSSQMAPVAQMLPIPDASAPGSSPSKKRRAWPNPPRFDDIHECKVTLPSLQQLHYSMQLQVLISWSDWHKWRMGSSLPARPPLLQSGPPVPEYALDQYALGEFAGRQDRGPAKRIRKSLQDEVDQDLTPQKKAITDLIMERFDKAQHKQFPEDNTNGVQEPAPTANGTVKAGTTNGNTGTSASPPASTKRKAESEELSSLDDESPAPKKVKKSKPTETDAQIAARLQAELNAGTRSTRGGGAKRKQSIKKEKKPKKKSSAKVNSDDDSDVESGDPKPEREKKGGFHKPMNLSEPLSALLGETQLSRPQTVKKIWGYVKERDLQNPKDKRQIMCDNDIAIQYAILCV